jgi:hypothetical protein
MTNRVKPHRCESQPSKGHWPLSFSAAGSTLFRDFHASHAPTCYLEKGEPRKSMSTWGLPARLTPRFLFHVTLVRRSRKMQALHIIAADDEADITRFYAKALTCLGHRVAVVHDGLQLVKLCQTSRPRGSRGRPCAGSWTTEVAARRLHRRSGTSG